ncbi:MAG: hypothetical protein H8E49_14445 [Gammaproteobacteria bacterium]|nr:hypothetical protein [Gammaproteobacteria bacterium]
MEFLATFEQFLLVLAMETDFSSLLMGISGFGAVEQLNLLAWKVRSESRFIVIGYAESDKESCLF